MDSEFQDLEDALKGMRPATPDAACLDRLLAAVEGRLQNPELSISGIESKLATLQPAVLSPELSARMLETLSRVPFPVDEKVVLFPGAQKPAAKPEQSRRPWYAAAAAVAVAGAFSALMVGGPKTPQAKSGNFADNRPVITNADSRNFVPASMGSGLQDATDQGVTWTKDGKPMRVVRVVFKDKVKLTNPRGEIVEVERPRVQYFLVPEKID